MTTTELTATEMSATGMPATEFLIDGPDDADITVILAHGAGAGMDHAFMAMAADAIAQKGVRVIRFDFPYMRRRKVEGRKFPPNRAPVLLEALADVLDRAPVSGKVILAGKSMGGRMASLFLSESASRSNDNSSDANSKSVAGYVALGFPFFAPGKDKIADNNRGSHLQDFPLPGLIIQGERDNFGGAEELAALPLADNIQTLILPDGDHSFKPRKKSGESLENNIARMADGIAAFADTLK
ncbi:Uncharacterised protein [BD1-7 clade bacterium]|uniref:KANL3/Tex30 alpha/beta hydrolase-like domain-containing protein n=1 Tax=BD1-7 clade bacterium TaxID=2029982 RepID=A0A5S9PUT6_9GAMM|nr:Uncharacterised protein [BD1-7 clade bacterium]